MKSVQLNKEIIMKTSSPQFTITKEYAEYVEYNAITSAEEAYVGFYIIG